MCRQNQLWGCVLMAFGLGVLIGMWLESGFLCYLFGIGLLVLGAGMAKRK